MTDPNKKVKNPLLNVAVTGGTIEDFSQHALLLPAKEKSPPPILTSTTERSFQTNYFNQIPIDYQTEYQDSFSQSSIDLQQTNQHSNYPSVLSSFSNIINLGNNEDNSFVPSSAGIDSFINQNPTNVEPIPLFPSTGAVFQNPKPTQGPVNFFRRQGLKRPVYAQVPGLSSNHQSPCAPLINNLNNPILSEFKPISNPSYSNNSTQGPVMAAISANEILQTPMSVSDSVTNGEILNSITGNSVYRPVYHHWFFKQEIEGKTVWKPFSMVDSLALEQAFTSNDLDPDKFVATDGGRYDVNILRRQRIPVYWKGNPTEVRRCSWFHKGNSDGRYVPYEENIATKLEEEYKVAYELKQWNRKVELGTGETVVFHAADVLVLFPQTQTPDTWNNASSQTRPRIVKRGMDEFDIDEGEPSKVDHLLFMVHGIGSVCDLKFRSVEEVVDEFRHTSLQLVQSHYRSSCEQGVVNKIEILPISWHEELHSEETGIDKTLKSITLDSIPRLRDFTNDTLLDILFYTSPVYCQTIISTVGLQLNKIYELFKLRNPSFKGGVSLAGHSLGSLILFDLLCHQHSEMESPTDDNGGDVVMPLNESSIPSPPPRPRFSRRISYMMGSVGTGQPQIFYPHLNFQPTAFFALGSPIGMFVTVRGLDKLGEHFALPTCPAFFNIFHPYDPVAYRIESLINPELAKLKPVLISHHKGRKRMHLELKETMARVGADLKAKFLDSMKSTWNSFYQLAMFHKQDQPSLEEEVDKALKQHLDRNMVDECEEQLEDQQTDLSLGILNKSKRVDYVLQEAPLEFFNEYIFALTSHVCYWDSQDTMLFIIKEIYSSMNITTDNKIPQQTMTIERPPSSPKSGRSDLNATYILKNEQNLGPPPISGFVKKT